MISEFPLFVFTTLGGLAAGTYVAAAFAPCAALRRGKRPWVLPLVCLVLLGAGLLGVLGHLGRPERFLNALANPAAMIAEEAYWSMALGVLMLVDLVLAFRKKECPRAVGVLAGVAAAGLIAVMATAYVTSYGNPAWAAWPTAPLYVVGDLAMGAALCLVLADEERTPPFAVASAVLAVLAAASFAAVGAHFASCGLSAVPFAVAAVLALAAAVLAAVARAGKATAAAPAAFVAVLAAVAVARYAFYAASIL